jgi:deoxycytidine triphosphate deaminase
VLLSDHDIKAELASGRVKLDPYAPELIPTLSIDIRLDRYFRVFENHRYPHIDPAVEQPELTRLVETGESVCSRTPPRAGSAPGSPSTSRWSCPTSRRFRSSCGRG